ncbi:uroporphyrinogen-III synthase [Guptibacillus hwajinpoensis]|uniref:Uroporphyrinogen-III synthase n=1 Tax=Guptibacillus hwajinpoensis TaxID=208199 RepID=A0ABU0JWH2_9BACL|nr:uroporphyrinogen-III synthase [Alkalihalobacillus hemicentroti]MDQ0481409.1 uroporphyrinogen-III synthase [Alkalihalobacillus hemicentroti]
MMSPLSGKRVLVTRAREQAAAFTKLINERGGLSVEIPLISFEPRNDILKSIEVEKYHWILFTSANGVRFFFQHSTLPKNSKVGAVGTKTAKVLEKYGVQIDLLPEDFIAEGLVAAMSRYTFTGEKILLPRGNLGRDELPEQLSELGYDVTDLPIYNTVIPQGSGEALEKVADEQALDVITFTSSSTVHHFMQLLEAKNLKDRFKGITIVVIGPITAETLLSYGFHPHVVPEKYTIEGMLESLEQYFQQLGG